MNPQPVKFPETCLSKKRMHFSNLTTFCARILAASGSIFITIMGPGKLLWTATLLAFRKLFAVALTISFTLAPLSTAFAQEAATDSVATDTGTGDAPPVSDSTDRHQHLHQHLHQTYQSPALIQFHSPLSPDTTSDAGGASTGAASDDTTLSTTPDTPTDDATLSAKPPAMSPCLFVG
jgi:hypothetical protein